ncbi:MAG: phage tail tape measure protein [Alphaproteobacteria bacterium]|nr:phage tail tape measure protein [Alphaproteobacteria bacterium]
MTVKIGVDASEFSAALGDAGAEFERIATERLAPAALIVEDAFADAARAIERELARAARTGEISLKRLGRAIVTNLTSNLADSLVRRPIETLLTSALTGGASSAISGAISGGRADGGLVAPGQSFLVGERGPEIFTPGAAGRIRHAGAAPVNVSIMLPGVTDAASFRASESQIAAGLARALARGERNR